MSDDPNERAARLAGRWGDEGDEDHADDGTDEDGENAAEQDGGAAKTTVDDPVEGESAASASASTSASDDPDAGSDQIDEVEDTGVGGGDGENEGGEDGAEEGDGADDAGDGDRELTTREMQSQMLYLPPAFHKEVDLTFEELNLRFRRERDRKLEKNRDFYLGLLRLGLEELGDVGDRELDEIEELLDL